jgi:hypothetical protein
VINFDHISKLAKRLWLWLLRKDILIFLLFVGITSIFWWGRAMSSPRDVEIHVPVTYTGVSEQIVFEQTLPKIITLSVRDNGRQLRQIAHQHLNLHINLSHYLSREEGTITLSADILRPRLQDLLPGSTTILQIEPETIESAYYIQQTKLVPVVVQSQVTIASQHQLDGDKRIVPNMVQIFGNQDAIDTIHYVMTDSIQVTNLRDSVRITTNLITPEGIRIHPKTVDVLWKAEPFTEKTFTIPVQVIDIPEGKHVRLFPQQVNVVVRVGISHFTEVQANDLQVICHYPKQQCSALPVEVLTNNPYITNIRISPSSVEYLIHF